MEYLEFENALELINSVKVLSEALADSSNLADLNCASIFRMIQFVLESAEQPMRKALEETIASEHSFFDTSACKGSDDAAHKE